MALTTRIKLLLMGLILVGGSHLMLDGVNAQTPVKPPSGPNCCTSSDGKLCCYVTWCSVSPAGCNGG